MVTQLCCMSLAADEEWEIDKSELTLGRELGSGQFGVRNEYVVVCVCVCVCLSVCLSRRVYSR